MENKTVLSLKHITKTFPGVKALDDVSFDLREGEVHSICGENGAGKSTLMKILSGVYSLDEGEIWIDGELAKIHNSQDSLKKGISIIYQEVSLVDPLSITENIFTGRMVEKGQKIVRWKELNKKAEELLARVGLNLNPETIVRKLSAAEKQLIEIAKALSYNAKIIIMDEPTSSIATREVDRLFEIINDLRDKGVSIIYISHKMEEIKRISDRVSIMRDGKMISTYEKKDINESSIIHDMVGRSMDQSYPKRDNCIREDIALELEHLTSAGVFNDISFTVHKGEVFGLAGLVGAGRTEIVRAIFGADPYTSGAVYVNGEKTRITSPNEGIKKKIALLTEDRKTQGLMLTLPICENTTAANLKTIVKNGFVNKKQEKIIADEYIGKLKIKATSNQQKVGTLSGGNMQKVVVGKWLFADSDIIILDEPTRGIDVGAKYEIYELINQLVADGKAIIFISSELPELLAMSDKVLVIADGKTKGCLSGGDITAENVMRAIVQDRGESNEG